MGIEMHQKPLKNLLISLIFLLFAHDALAWGRLGHETVAEVARYEIRGSHAEAEVKALLKGEESLVSASIWADCAKGFQYCHADLSPEMDHFVRNNPKHHHYHYADIPFQDKHYEGQGIGANPNDVVHVLKDAIKTLRTHTPPAGRSWTEREALFLVIHLIGDIHQPLHVGAAYVDAELHFFVPNDTKQAEATNTSGGNILCYRTKSLHAAWDDDFVLHAMREHHVKDAFEFSKGLVISAHAMATPSGNPEDWVESWADESLELSAQALKRVSVVSMHEGGTARSPCANPHANEKTNEKQEHADSRKGWDITLPEGYSEQASHEVTHRLAQAGGRLARVLKAIWP